MVEHVAVRTTLSLVHSSVSSGQISRLTGLCVFVSFGVCLSPSDPIEGHELTCLYRGLLGLTESRLLTGCSSVALCVFQSNKPGQ